MSTDTDSYPIFVMSQLTIANGIIDNDLPYDEIWPLANQHYHAFRNSKYNDENRSEYDCMMEYIKEQLSVKKFKLDEVGEVVVRNAILEDKNGTDLHDGIEIKLPNGQIIEIYRYYDVNDLTHTEVEDIVYDYLGID